MARYTVMQLLESLPAAERRKVLDKANRRWPARLRHRASTPLTPMEVKVVRRLRRHPSWTVAEIADALGVSPKTVESHQLNAGRKLRAQGRSDLVAAAEKAGVI